MPPSVLGVCHSLYTAHEQSLVFISLGFACSIAFMINLVFALSIICANIVATEFSGINMSC